MDRRRALKVGIGLAGSALLSGRAAAVIASDKARPIMTCGVMSGDVLSDRAMIWSAADRTARMVVEWSRDANFARAERREGPLATPDTALAASLDLTGLPQGAEIHYRVAFHDPDNPRAISDWTKGRLLVPGAAPRPLRFVFSGDECGQGYGINPEFGGYRMYETMRGKRPDFFLHQGDQIYADGPLAETVKLADGSTWRNIVTPAKMKAAASLEDFRGAFAYNLMDLNKRRFLAETPMLVAWDDHEVRNNWYPGKILPDGTPVDRLAAWARRAMLEYNPMRLPADAPGVQRAFSWGPLLDVFLLDARSKRGDNPAAMDASPGAGMFGQAQIEWLKGALAASKATWKLIASDIPLSLVVNDYKSYTDPVVIGSEGLANGKPGAPGGREAEFAELLSFIKARGIANTVWISADVHHASAIHYHPDRAAFRDFTPFWEIIAGPLNAGSASMLDNKADPTFGPEVVFAAVPARITDNSPRAGLQFFGMGEIDPRSRALTVSINDINGRELWRKVLPAS